MGEMLVVHRENDAFAVLVRDHVIHVDQPYGAGGMDIGPTPVELFVASLAARAAYYARRFLARRGLPATGLEVTARLRDGAGSPRPGVAHRSAAAASHPALRGGRRRAPGGRRSLHGGQRAPRAAEHRRAAGDRARVA